MNDFVEWKMDDFKDYYNWLEKEKQLDILRKYYWNAVNDILWIIKWRKYCEILALNLIEKWKINIWNSTFEELVNEIEYFIKKRKNKILSKTARNIIAYLKKKDRKARIG